jgi:glycosidase
MNHIGTHDTARILTRLGTNETFYGDRESQSSFELNENEYKKAVKLLKLAAVLQYTLPGVPSIYYGDEAGVTGFGDPFCRKTYPWGKENAELVDFYKYLGKVRRENDVFKEGEFVPVTAENGLISFLRKTKDSQVFVAVNRNDFEMEIELPKEFKKAKNQKCVLPSFGFIIM